MLLSPTPTSRRRGCAEQQRAVEARERVGGAFRFGMIAALLLGACTLTGDDFEPEVSEGPLTASPGGSGGGSSEPQPGPGVEVDECSPACAAGKSCVDGACVATECASAEDISDCEIELCAGGSCDTCSDGEQSDGETGVDCGGACEPCALGGGCVVGTDCVNGSCIGGTCRAPTCDDGVPNQDESGRDCGGATCPRCGVGDGCSGDGDCGAGLFCAGTACSPVSCQDGDLNGAEVGVDCGGGACPGCPVSGPCETGADCESRSCGPAQTCVAPTCADGIVNQDETAADCGGSCAANCDPGEGCRAGGDCGSGVCGAVGCAPGTSLCCQASTCSDGVQNGSEPTVDCGNAACGLCAVGRPCSAGGQCQTGVCGQNGTCAALVCGDGQRNGLEGDIDCGGAEPNCPRCGDRRTCRIDSDCQSGDCSGGFCVSCTDGVQDGDEGGVDCGGTRAGCPACPRCTESNSIDMQAVGVLNTLPANGCGKITQFPSYSPTLLQTEDFGPFPFNYSWSQACSGQRGTSSFDRGFHQRQQSGFSTACPIIFEFQGSAANFGLRWY